MFSKVLFAYAFTIPNAYNFIIVFISSIIFIRIVPDTLLHNADITVSWPNLPRDLAMCYAYEYSPVIKAIRLYRL